MKFPSRKTMAAALAAVVTLAGSAGTRADTISYDEVLSQGDIWAAQLSANVEMWYSGGVLTILMQNTSGDLAGSGAGTLLTGIGFNLPQGVAISSGSVSMSGSTAVGFSYPTGGDVSSEWGYDNTPINSGHYLGVAQTSVNTSVSAMEPDTEFKFSSGSIAQPDGLNGPDFGMISAAETDGLGAGVEGILDSVLITLNLTGSFVGDLVDWIDSQGIALTFGSPSVSSPPHVPEGGLTVGLLGFALLAVEGARRRLRRV